MGISGNSSVGKSYSSFIVSEELLQKIVEAVQKGEKQARSSGDIQSFEIYSLGFRQNISIGRIFLVPPSICNNAKDFPTALLYGCLVRVLGTGGEELGDMITFKIGESEFDTDEYNQLQMSELKKTLFVNPADGKEASLIIYAPNWLNAREYVAFHFTKDSEQLKNNLRHQVFCAYFDPKVSSAFNAIVTNLNTTKIDVTNITPKIPFPFLAENVLKQYPDLKKQAAYNKEKILLNHKTADAVTQAVLDPQELDVFDSLNEALENSLMPDTKSLAEAGEGGYHTPAKGEEVPRLASDKQAKWTMKCPWCKGEAKKENHEDEYRCTKCDWTSKEGQKAAASKKHSWADGKCSYCGQKWSVQGADKECPKRKKASDEAPLAAHESPISNVGPGTEAHEKQKDMVPAMHEALDNIVEGDEPIGIEIDDQGLPVHKGDDKTAADNPSTRKHENKHPETLRVSPDRLSSAVSAAYNGGFVDKHKMPPKQVRDYINANMGDNSKYAPQAAADHEKQIEAGIYGDDPLSRRSQEKWGSAKVAVNFNKKAGMAPEEFVAEHLAAELDDFYEASSPKTKQARDKRENTLSKYRNKEAVALDIDSIWSDITEDFGPAPLVDVPSSAPSEGSDGGEKKESPTGRPRKRDMGQLPEAMRSDKPEETKAMSDSEAESEENSMPEAKESAWRLDSKLADFVQDVYDDVNVVHPDLQRMKQLAQVAIDNDADVIYDIAADAGQIVDNVKHMDWFVDAVAEEVSHDPELQQQLDTMGSRGTERKFADTADNPATKPESQGNQLKGNDKPLAKKPELRGDAPMKPQKPQPPHEDAADKQSYAKTDKDKVKTADEVNNENWQCMNCGHEGKLSPRGKCEACGSDAVDSVLPGQPERARHAVASKKFADTADNPANEKGGEGAMLPKTDKDKVKTSGWVNCHLCNGKGCDKCNHTGHYNTNDQGDMTVQPISNKTPSGSIAPPTTYQASKKKANPVQSDISEAKSETVSPDTVDPDIQQATVSVEKAGKVAYTSDGDDGKCPGCGDVLNNANGPYCGGKYCPKNTDPGDLPQKESARYQDEDTENGRCPDCGESLHGGSGPYCGGKYCTSRKKKKGGDLLQMPNQLGQKPGETPEIFLTPEEKGLQNQKVSPKPPRKTSADVNKDIAEAKAGLDYNKGEMADNSEATHTVNPEHFAANRSDGVPESQGETADTKQPVSDYTGGTPEAPDVPVQVDSKQAAAHTWKCQCGNVNDIVHDVCLNCGYSEDDNDHEDHKPNTNLIRMPRGATQLPDKAGWTNRFTIKSESSDRKYNIAQNEAKRHWGCSCPGWVSRRNCKHLRELGLPGNEVPFEAMLKAGSLKQAEKQLPTLQVTNDKYKTPGDYKQSAAGDNFPEEVTFDIGDLANIVLVEEENDTSD